MDARAIVAGAAAVTVLAASAALTTAEAMAASAPAASPARPSSSGASSPLLLVDGTRLLARPAPGGGSAVTVLPGAAPGGLISLRLPGRTEEIPAEDLPYLGHGLDPSLFDLNALERAEVGGRLPVRVTFTGARPQLPGVTITSSGRATAAGYLTAAGARAFGSVLRGEPRPGTGTEPAIVGDGTDIALAGAPVPPARPDLATHTLTVTAANLASEPDNGGTAWVFDGSDLAAYTNLSTFRNGVAKFSVPAGRYWVMGEFDSIKPASSITRLDILPEVTVGADTTAHVAATAATSEVTMTTPRAAAPAAVTFTAAFRDQHGNSAGVDWFDAPGAIWVSPMSRKPAGGALQAYASEVAASSLRPGVNPYVYNLDYADTPDVIPAQHYQVRPSSLATVTERYYRDSSSSGAWDNFGAFPEQGFVSWILRPLALPGTQVQYFSTGPQLIWNTTIYARASASGFPSGGQQDDAWHVLSPGPQAMDWNDYPLHPQPEVSAGGPGGSLFPLIPSAIRVGNTLTLTMRPFGDNQPGHLGSPVATQTSSYQIDQNGTPIAHGSAGNGIPPVTLSPKPSLISFTLNAARTGPAYRLSASSQTTWTWRSAPDPGATVPSSWYCSQSQSGQLLRRCVVQPLLTLNYQVRGLTLSATAPAGRQLVRLHVGAAWSRCGQRPPTPRATRSPRPSCAPTSHHRVEQ